MAITCVHCGQAGDAPPAGRVPFKGAVKEQILTSICAGCWKEWESIEVRVINEHRLNLMDPEHRQMLSRACREYLRLPQP